MNQPTYQLLMELVRDVERLIPAGAQSVTGHERLREHARKLSGLAGQVPALGRLVERIEQVVQAATPETTSRALLDLLQASRQLRASLAQPQEIAGELQPAEPCCDWNTQLSVAEVIAEVGLIWRSGPHRMKIRSGDHAMAQSELRLVGRLLTWLDQGHHRFVHDLVEQVIPQLGPQFIPELSREPFDRSRAGSMHRLVALAKLDPEVAFQQMQQLAPELNEYLPNEATAEPRPKAGRRKAS